MRNYKFPARKEEIDVCCDLEQLRQWKHEFEMTLAQMESEFGGNIDNAPEKIWKYAKANRLNLENINRRIDRIMKPVSSAAALKRFHDKVKELFPSEYDHIVDATKVSLGQPDADWQELIKPTKPLRR